MKYRFVMVAVCVIGFGCEVPRPVQSARAYHYSPFVVQVPESRMSFKTITFKDVGLHRDATDPSDRMLEAIAESLSHELQESAELAVTHSRVEYHGELSDPAHHMSCEANHLYVDLWNGRDQWGYSLWSGCGEGDNFAWRQVAIPTNVTWLVDRVMPLADDIAHSLTLAHERKCFRRHC